MSALLLTAAATAASFVPPSFSPQDIQSLMLQYPQDALAGGRSAAVMVDAQVDPKGRVSHCKATVGYGDPKLANDICGLVNGMKIEPASIQGQHAYGVVRQFLRFYLPQTDAGGKISRLREPSDVEVQVNVLPAGQASLRVIVNVLVDIAGKPQACVSSGAPAGYGDVACSQVSGITFGPMQDKDGKAVQYVRTVAIDFMSAAG